MARVLFTSCPAYGHMLPLMPLIRAAERAGNDVRIATGTDLVGPLTSRGLTVHAAGPTWDVAWSAHLGAWADPDKPEQQKMIDGVVALFGLPALARLDDLILLAQEWRPDVVVHEVLEPAGSWLARQLEVPGVVHGIGPMFAFYSQLIGAAGAAVGQPELWEQVSIEQAFDLCPPALQPDGPRPWPKAASVRPTAGEPGQVPAAVAEALMTERPVAYFTLGTVKNTDTTDFSTALTALEIWDGVVVATTGRQLDLDELGPIPSNIVVAEFVPQAAVIERAELLVSHSGSGTMLGGLVHGVPQVALPRGTDQPQNAALLARAGAGVVVAPEDYAAETIAAAITAVTEQSSYRAAAGRVREEIAAMPDADTAWAGLEI
jgi:UDP:flavonoid glycosyltransferase YjiC (YdhE family)